MKSPSKYLSRLTPYALATVVFLTIFGGSIGVMSYLYVQAMKHRQDAIRLHAADITEIAAGLVDVELHESLVRPEQLDSPEYLRAIAPLVRFQLKHPNLQYLWTVRVLPDGEQILVLLSSTNAEVRKMEQALGRAQVDIPFLGPNPDTELGAASVTRLRRGERHVFPDIFTDAYDGSYIEARFPLKTPSGRFIGYLGADYALDRYVAQINEVRFAGLVSLGLSLILSLLLAQTAYRVRKEGLQNLSEVSRQRELANKASQLKSELLAIASHDLKNPLSAISGMSGLLLKNKRKQEDQSAVKQDVLVLDTIRSSADQMLEIVRGILSNEGIEHGSISLKLKTVDVSELCSEVVRFGLPSAVKKQIEIRTEIERPLELQADENMLHEAFDNYVSNAVKYSPEGGKVDVRLQRLPDGKFMEFSVTDEGLGLSAEDQALLFQKFKKLTPRPTAGETSTGLGLSIVKTVAELHQGSVGCDSQPGHGSRFWLRLPLSQSVT